MGVSGHTCKGGDSVVAAGAGHKATPAKFARRVNSTQAEDNGRVARWRILLAPSCQDCAKRGPIHVARFSYDVLSINREQATYFIRREAEAASRVRLKGRLLVPLSVLTAVLRSNLKWSLKSSISSRRFGTAVPNRTARPTNG
jgi:hypothetical protein